MTMRTLLYPEYKRLEIATLTMPSVARDEVLLRVAACGICGSELEAFKSKSPRRVPPLVMGHEFCGIIEEVGEEARSFSIGDQVVSHSLFGCGICARCTRGDSHLCAKRQLFGMNRAGGFAEYVNAPEHCLVPWPKTLAAEAASLAEPLANGVHVVGLTRQANPSVVAIIGAGPIGLLCQQAFQCLSSADVIVADLIPERLSAASQLGAKQTVDSREGDFVNAILSLTAGEGADVVVDAVGSELSKRQSLCATRPGGTAVWIGLHENSVAIKSHEVTLSERQIQGSYAASLNELKTAVELLASGRVEWASWIRTYPLAEGVDAFHTMLAARGNNIKAVLIPGE